MSDGRVSGSDGNILFESITNEVLADSQASLVNPSVTSSPINRKSALLIPEIIDNQL